MLNSAVRLGFGLLALAFARSADAQGDLDQGKTAALRISLRVLPQVAAKRYQDQMDIWTRKFSKATLYGQL